MIFLAIIISSGGFLPLLNGILMSGNLIISVSSLYCYSTLKYILVDICLYRVSQLRSFLCWYNDRYRQNAIQTIRNLILDFQEFSY